MTELMTTRDEPVPLMRFDQGLAKLSDFLAASGWFGCQNEHQAYVKVLCGAELGLTPVASMMGIHVVEGRPMLSYTVMASLLRRHPSYDYRVIEQSRAQCLLEFTRKAEGQPEPEVLGRYGLTMQEAIEQGLATTKSGSLKANWSRHPDAMLFARCLSQGCRFFCPDAFLGGAPLYAEAMGEGEVEQERPAQGVYVADPVASTPAAAHAATAEPDWDDEDDQAAEDTASADDPPPPGITREPTDAELEAEAAAKAAAGE